MKKIAVIGAGASGLPAIKCCLDDGFDVVCFERTDDIGGLWNFRDTPVAGQASVMRSTIINTSKELMSYSDFPIPKEYPNFMHNTKVQQYFRLYAEKFGLLKHINFKTDVVKVKPAANFKEHGQWDIEVRDLVSGKTRVETFDGVLLCSGHHADKHMAHFEGEEDFIGKRMHTHDYRDHKGYEGKRIVVIGFGNSGGDIAVELGKFGSQVFLSTRRGSWVVNRVEENGLPTDYLFNRHFLFDIRHYLPRRLTNYVAERKLNKRFDHALYGVKPNHSFDAQHVTINDELPNRIISGSVIIKPNIKRITKTGVEFDDGSFEDNIDVIIYGTGYTFGFPYMEHEALKVVKNQVNLFKYVFPPDVQPSTLAVIGCFQPLGAIMPISELQARWALRVFKGDRPLPSVDEMWKDIRLKKATMSQRYVESQRHTIQVDYATFMDELAILCGCNVEYANLFKTDPKLAYLVYFGPASPYQYRLSGHGSWSGAREAIMTLRDRIDFPFQTRKTRSNGPDYLLLFYIALFIAIIAFIVKVIF